MSTSTKKDSISLIDTILEYEQSHGGPGWDTLACAQYCYEQQEAGRLKEIWFKTPEDCFDSYLAARLGEYIRCYGYTPGKVVEDASGNLACMVSGAMHPKLSHRQVITWQETSEGGKCIWRNGSLARVAENPEQAQTAMHYNEWVIGHMVPGIVYSQARVYKILGGDVSKLKATGMAEVEDAFRRAENGDGNGHDLTHTDKRQLIQLVDEGGL